MKDSMIKEAKIKEAKSDFIEMLVLTLAVVLFPGVTIAISTIACIINFTAGMMACNLVMFGLFAVVLIGLGVYFLALGIKDYKRDLAFIKRNFK